MKVGILTFPNSSSYGAVLQMYALYKKVNDLGHDVEIINYYNPYMKAEKHVHRNTGVHSVFSHAARRVLHLRLEKFFRSFEKKNMKLFPQKAIVDKTQLCEIGKRYDAVICGSDQVWNPNITDSDLSYFLDFCSSETKRISYAPSFGVETLSEAFSESVQRELQLFSSISVREAQGQVYLNQLLGRDVPVVMDPTFLVSAQEWEALERPHPLAEGDYILYYTIQTSQSLYRKCREFSQKTGMRIVVVGGNSIKQLRNRDPLVDYAVDISPEQWLYLVNHARYVVTNSFHGTAFSINFRKDFYLELPIRFSSRLEHIMKVLGLEDRMLSEDGEIGAAKMDYRVAQQRLQLFCAESFSYLKSALENDHG